MSQLSYVNTCFQCICNISNSLRADNLDDWRKMICSFGTRLSLLSSKSTCTIELTPDGPRKNGLRKNGPRKMIPRKNGPRKNGPREKWSPKNWSPEKWPSKIVLRQKNARKFKLLFSFLSIDFTTHTKKCLTFTS